MRAKSVACRSVYFPKPLACLDREQYDGRRNEHGRPAHKMTQLEYLHGKINDLSRLNTRALTISTFVLNAIVLPLSPKNGWLVIIAFVCCVIAPITFDIVYSRFWPPYRDRVRQITEIQPQLQNLQAGIAEINRRYRSREKGEQFKKAYSLAGRELPHLEEALGVGMLRENREVFVTAFMRRNKAVRVTATIGSPFQCSPSDNPRKWSAHIKVLACDSIRIYHNHPERSGATRPSPLDIQSAGTLRRILGPHAEMLNCLVICWNQFGEWKVFAYNHKGEFWLESEFDSAVSATLPASSQQLSLET